jgi:hypothetical protein
VKRRCRCLVPKGRGARAFALASNEGTPTPEQATSRSRALDAEGGARKPTRRCPPQGAPAMRRFGSVRRLGWFRAASEENAGGERNQASRSGWCAVKRHIRRDGGSPVLPACRCGTRVLVFDNWVARPDFSYQPAQRSPVGTRASRLRPGGAFLDETPRDAESAVRCSAPPALLELVRVARCHHLGVDGRGASDRP